MASVRGFLNIQSLNELTYEKCAHSSAHCGAARAFRVGFSS